MLIEVQLSRGYFLNVFRGLLRRRIGCQAFAPPWFVVDGVDIQSNHSTLGRAKTELDLSLADGSKVKLEASRLQVTQRIGLVLKEISVNPNTKAIQSLDPVNPVYEAELNFALTARAHKGDLQLCAKFLSVDLTFDTEEALGQQAAIVEGRLEDLLRTQLNVDADGTCTAFGLGGSVNALLGPHISSDVLNGGISANHISTTVAIRVELGAIAADAQSRWLSFFGGQHAGSLPPAANWGLMVDGRLLVARIISDLKKILQAIKAKGDLEFGTPTGEWRMVVPVPSGLPSDSPWPFLPGSKHWGVEARFSGKAKNTDCGVDIDFDARLIVVSTKGPDNRINTYLRASFDKSDWDALKCSLVSGFTLLPIGLATGNLFVALGAFFAGFAFATYKIAATEQSIPAAPDCQKLDEDGLEQLCTEILNFDPIGNRTDLLTAVNLPFGLSTTGMTTLFEPKKEQLGVLKIDLPNPMKYMKPCKSGDWAAEAKLVCGGGPPWDPVWLCSTETLQRFQNPAGTPADEYFVEYDNDPDGLYKVWVPAWPANTIKVRFTVHPSQLGSIQNLYPCRLLVRSNRGAQLVQLEPPEWDAANQDQKEFEHKLVCMLAEGLRDWPVSGLSLFDLDPVVLSGVVDLTLLVVSVELGGLARDESIQVTDAAGRPLGAQGAGRRGVAQVLARLPTDDGGGFSVTRELTADGARLRGEAGRRHPGPFGVELQKYRGLAPFATGQGFCEIRAGHAAGRPAALLVAGDVVTVFRFDGRLGADPLFAKRICGLAGATWLGADQLLVWGAPGLGCLRLDGASTGVIEPLAQANGLAVEGAIDDVVVSGRTVATLTRGEIRTYTREATVGWQPPGSCASVASERLRPLGSLRIDGASQIFGTGSLLAVATEDGITTVDVGDPLAPQRGREIPIDGRPGLFPVLSTDPGELVFAQLAEGHGALVRLGGDSKERDDGRGWFLDQAPWWLGAARLGRHLLVVEAGGREARVWQHLVTVDLLPEIERANRDEERRESAE